ncbi:MAG: hypothetical protein RLZ51_2383, partial [Pseudomonadota bacterium]
MNAPHEQGLARGINGLTAPLPGAGAANPALVSNSDFLRVLYGGFEDGTFSWVCHFPTDPSAQNPPWAGRPYACKPAQGGLIDGATDHNCYFSTAVLQAHEGEIARRGENFVRLAVLTLDDVVLTDVAGVPTYVIETSPGKFQAGIRIDPNDPDARNKGLVDRVMRACGKRVGNDASGNACVRYVRLPRGRNTKTTLGKPFGVRLDQWNPEQVFDLNEACSMFDIDLGKIKDEAPAASLENYASNPVLRAPHGVGEGKRNETAFKYASSLRSRGASLEEARLLIMAFADNCQPPLDRQEALRCLESAWRYPEGKSAEFLSPRNDFPASARPLFIAADELIASAKPPEWIIKGHLEANTLAVMFGDPEAGKSFVSISMACSIATGHPWMSHE